MPQRLLLRRSLVMAAACAPVGAAAGGWVSLNAIGQGYELFWLASALGAASAGGLCWRVVAAARPGPARGAFAGFLAGVLGHWITWFLMLAGSWIAYQLTGSPVSSLGEPPADPLVAAWGAAAYSLFSLIVCGWLTAPGGAILGALLGKAQAKAAEGKA